MPCTKPLLSSVEIFDLDTSASVKAHKHTCLCMCAGTFGWDVRRTLFGISAAFSVLGLFVQVRGKMA